MLAKLTVWGLLLAITSEGPHRPEIGGNSELVPFKRKEKIMTESFKICVEIFKIVNKLIKLHCRLIYHLLKMERKFQMGLTII